MSKESDDWAWQRKAGLLDEPLYPNWVVPNCSMCSNRAWYAYFPNGCVETGCLEFPPYDGAIFYCEIHKPRKETK